MSDNNVESGEDEGPNPTTPLWLIVIKWILVIINCMYILADCIVLIMGKSVALKLDSYPESDLTLRIEGAIELIIAVLGLIGLIGEKFFVLAFHCIANIIYCIYIRATGGTESGDGVLFLSTFLWITASIFYTYQIRVRRNRVNQPISNVEEN